jgi:hypothetical protein
MVPWHAQVTAPGIGGPEVSRRAQGMPEALATAVPLVRRVPLERQRAASLPGGGTAGAGGQFAGAGGAEAGNAGASGSAASMDGTAGTTAGAGSAGSAGAPSAPLAKEDLPEEMAEAICANAGDCCTRGGFAHVPAECRTNVIAYFEQAIVYYDALGSRYDDVAAGGCAEGYADWLLQCDGTRDESWREFCYLMFEGTLMPGDACEQSIECAGENLGRAYCSEDPADPGGPDVCISDPDPAEQVQGELGDPCFATCIVSVGTSRCRVLPIGEPPPGSVACFTHEGLECSEASRMCEPLPLPGEACFDVCVEGAYCTGGTCEAKLPDGAPCSDNGRSCMSGDCIDGACGVAPVASEALCAGNLGRA